MLIGTIAKPVAVASRGLQLAPSSVWFAWHLGCLLESANSVRQPSQSKCVHTLIRAGGI